MTTSGHRVGLWFRTTRKLRPDQVAHRVRLRTRKVANDLSGSRLVERRLRFAPDTWPRRLPIVTREAVLHDPAEAERMARGELTLLHEDFVHPDGVQWLDPAISRLRLYHLHYFDFVWAFVAHPDRAWATAAFGDLLRSWSDQVPLGAWSPWHPYVVATRGWNLAQAVPHLFDRPDPEVASLVWLHGDQLLRNLERDVGGNHLFRDLRSLIGLGAAFDERRWIDTGVAQMSRSLRNDVGADGGHFERSAFYHAQVLVDLRESIEVLRGSGREVPEPFVRTEAAMSRYLDHLSARDGDLPVFNDGVRRYPRLDGVVVPSTDRLVDLDDTGYLVARCAPLHVVFDVGRPAPPELPAHGHCALLSLEVCVEGRPLLVNGGSSSYDDPEIRFRERSTLGHNTVRVDGTEQSEIWHTFRVARQAEPAGVSSTIDAERVSMRAAHDGYRRLPGAPVHVRSVVVSGEGMTVVDRIEGGSRHRAEGRWRIAPGVEVHADDGAVILDGHRLEVHGAQTVEVIAPTDADADWVADDYGLRTPVWSVRWARTDDAPFDVTTTLTPPTPGATPGISTGASSRPSGDDARSDRFG